MEQDERGSRLTQGPDTTHFVFPQRFQSGFRDSINGQRVTNSIEYFRAVAILPVTGDVMLHQLHNVAALQPFLRQVARQRHIFVEFKLHPVLRLSGNRVTNFVTRDKCSVIHIARTASVTPFGPVRLRCSNR
jgi:hypothetical protein